MASDAADFERSLWFSKGGSHPALTQDISAGVAIVGAGISGLSAALHLVQAGHDVVVIDAEQPGFGASGRNAAGCVPMWLGMLPSDVERRLGTEPGRRLNRLHAEAAPMLAELILQHGIACDMQKRGATVVAHRSKQEEWIGRLVIEWNQVGGAVRQIDHRIPESGKVMRAAVFDEAMTLNPLALTRGLADLCVHMGARIYGLTPAIDLSRTVTGWRIATPHGGIIAHRLIIATEGYAANQMFLPQLDRGCLSAPFALVASAPLENIGEILPNRRPVADTNRANPLWMMADPAGRLLVSLLPPRRRDLDAAAVGRLAERRIRRLFPDVSELPWEHYWEGAIALDPFGIPRFIEVADGVVAMGGYNGQGILPGFLAGRELARSLDGAGDVAIPFQRPSKAKPVRQTSWAFRNLLFPIARRIG